MKISFDIFECEGHWCVGINSEIGPFEHIILVDFDEPVKHWDRLVEILRRKLRSMGVKLDGWLIVRTRKGHHFIGFPDKPLRFPQVSYLVAVLASEYYPVDLEWFRACSERELFTLRVSRKYEKHDLCLEAYVTPNWELAQKWAETYMRVARLKPCRA